MIGKYELKKWFYDVLLTSNDRRTEILKFFDEHELLDRATTLMTDGRFEYFIENPTFEELKQIIWEL